MNHPERVRVAVIGAGFWAIKNHIPVLAGRDDVVLTSVCRLGQRELDTIKAEFGFRVASEDYEEALDAGVDAALICGPNGLHHRHAMAALGRGLHVLVEKPMALTGSEAWELVAEARRRGVHGLVPHGWHYAPFIVHARDLLAAGAVGRIQHVVCHMASAYRDLFDGRAGYGAIDLRGERFEADPATWSGRDGGYALGQLTHLAGLLCWLTDLRAQRVLGRTVTGVTGADIVDAGIVEFEGGALGSISGCGILPAGSRHQLDLRIFGDEGMLQLDVERERCVLRRHDGAHEDVPVEPGAGSYECRRAVNRFIDLIRALEDRNDSPLEASARATELIEALLVSAREGGRAVDVLTSEART